MRCHVGRMAFDRMYYHSHRMPTYDIETRQVDTTPNHDRQGAQQGSPTTDSAHAPSRQGAQQGSPTTDSAHAVSYTHLRAHGDS